MSRASDLANLIASGSTTIFGEAGAPTTNAGQSNQTGGTTNLQQGLAKAWNNFNGTGTVAIRESFNVSSLTDNATAEQSSNLTNSMANANYAGGGMSSGIAGTAYANLSRSLFNSTTTSAFSSGTTYTSTGASIDIEFNLFAIQGDLA